jgi:hypothetical protein
MGSRLGGSISVACKCKHDFTCKHCLSITADRNAADRNFYPLAFFETLKPDKNEVMEAAQTVRG